MRMRNADDDTLRTEWLSEGAVVPLTLPAGRLAPDSITVVLAGTTHVESASA